MCVYYSKEQVLKKDFLGPDFFFVKDVNRLPRTRWIVWREGMRYPDAIIELLSASTAKEDLGRKKDIYEKVFQTAEYCCYDPEAQFLRGWRLHQGHYESLTANEKGWLWSVQLQLWLGTWHGKYREYQDLWLRFYDKDGKLVLIASEEAELRAGAQQQRAETERQRAETENQRAESERQRADAAEAELARLKALLAAQEKNGGTP
jgi:hypothetical protein